MIPQIIAAVQTVEPMVKASRSNVAINLLYCIPWLFAILVWGLIIFGIVRLIKYLGSARTEQKLIRMELSKLADEVGQIRQELKGGTEKKPLEDSEGNQ